MLKRKIIYSLPLLALAIGFSFSVDDGGGGGGGGGQAKTQEQPAQTPSVDVDAKIAEAVNAERAKFQTQFKEATGHDSLDAFKQHQLKEQGKLQELADTNAQQATHFKSKYHNTLIKAELLGASVDAIDADVIHALLGSKASVDDNGVVTIDGKSVKDAVVALLKDKPHLAKASGSTGSGAPHSQNTNAKQLSTAEFDKLSPAEQMKFVKAGGSVVA